MTALIALAVTVPLLTWALDRDMRRAEEWRRQRVGRARFEESEAFRRTAANFEDLKRQIQEVMTPALAQMAESMKRAVEPLNKIAATLKEKP